MFCQYISLDHVPNPLMIGTISNKPAFASFGLDAKFKQRIWMHDMYDTFITHFVFRFPFSVKS